jgi:hypothetical protein
MQALARRFIPVYHCHPRSLLNKTLGGCSADAASAAGNQNTFTG